MRAAIVTEFGRPPRYSTFPEPMAEGDEVLVRVSHAARSPLVKAQAAGTHYSSPKTLPFVAGVDGVGRLEDERRVYFAFPRLPFGSLAETVPVRAGLCIALPANLDDATAAAAANAGMSSWAALIERAGLRRGESVLINGATGVSGRLAIGIAKHLGAKNVIATGRNPAVLSRLEALGADVVISLETPRAALLEALGRELRARDVTVILDYLWGQPALDVIDAIAAAGLSGGECRIRFVQIGGSASPTLTLDAHALRGSRLEILGSGLGSISPTQLLTSIRDFLHAIVPAKFEIATELAPLAEVEAAWNRDTGERRLVFAL